MQDRAMAVMRGDAQGRKAFAPAGRFYGPDSPE